MEYHSPVPDRRATRANPAERPFDRIPYLTERAAVRRKIADTQRHLKLDPPLPDEAREALRNVIDAMEETVAEIDERERNTALAWEEGTRVPEETLQEVARLAGKSLLKELTYAHASLLDGERVIDLARSSFDTFHELPDGLRNVILYWDKNSLRRLIEASAQWKFRTAA